MEISFDRDALSVALDEVQRVRCHAALTGALCASNDSPGSAQRAAMLAPRIDPQLLRQWADAIRAQLEASDLAFRLCLPTDEAPLEARINSLSAWSREFLSALGEAGGKLNELGSDAHDTLLELEVIGQGAEVGDEATENEEQMYTELVEHVRLSALLLYQLLNLPPAPVAQ